MDINLSIAPSSIINIDINTNKDDIILPVVPVFCFRGITGKNSIPDDSQQQKKFLNFLTELTKRSEQMGLDKALRDWNGKDSSIEMIGQKLKMMAISTILLG
jgi:hypothetical protein